MGFLSDLFSDNKEIDRCNFYLTGLVMCLYEQMQVWLKGRIEGLDYYYNWHKLIPFILFVIRVAHTKTDVKSQKFIEKEIEKYIYDNANPESYLNKFGDSNLQKHLNNYPVKSLVSTVAFLYNEYLEFYNLLIDKNVDPSISLNEHLAKSLATDNDDHRNLHDAFNLLVNNFSNGTFKLYKA